MVVVVVVLLVVVVVIVMVMVSVEQCSTAKEMNEFETLRSHLLARVSKLGKWRGGKTEEVSVPLVGILLHMVPSAAVGCVWGVCEGCV